MAYKSSRNAQLAQLSLFQNNQLQDLREELASLDTEIAALEENIVAQANLVCAARGVVGARGGTVPHPEKQPRSAKRAKQRLWQRRDGQVIRHNESSPTNAETLNFAPCGMVYTPFHKRFEAPRQSMTAHAANATITLVGPSASFASSVVAKDRVWLLYWLDRNDGLWREFVRPPRSKGGRVGLFATRSPNRPTPIGLSLCVVDHVDQANGVLKVSGVDILDETPLMAIKKYDSATECFPDALCGWLDDSDKVQPLYYDKGSDDELCETVRVNFADEAASKLDFIESRSVVNIAEMIRLTLRRVLSDCVVKDHQHEGGDGDGDGDDDDRHLLEYSSTSGSLAVGAFRISYDLFIAERKVVVTDVASGMRRGICEAEADSDPEALLHLSFQNSYSLQNQ